MRERGVKGVREEEGRWRDREGDIDRGEIKGERETKSFPF